MTILPRNNRLAGLVCSQGRREFPLPAGLAETSRSISSLLISSLLSRLQLLPLLLVAACSSGKSAAPSPAMSVAPIVDVTRLEPHTVPVYADFVGQTQAVASVEIHAQVTGFLQQIAFKEGSIVHKGQLLFVIDPRPYQDTLEQAQATLAVDEATLNNAQEIVKRYTPLEQEHAISKQELDTAIAQAQENRATVKLDKAKIAAAQLNVDYTRVLTPMTGYIGVSQVKVGDLIQSGTTLMDTVYSITPMYVTFAVSENQYLAYMERGRKHPRHPQPIRLILGNGVPYGHTGTINMVAPAVNPSTGTLQLRAVFPNPHGLLKQGLFVRVRLVTEEADNALLVPENAIQHLLGSESVFLVGAGNKVRQATIATGATVDNDVIATSGVAKGDLLITQGIEKVRPGMRVRTRQVPEQIPNIDQAGPGTPPAAARPATASAAH